MQRLEEIGLHGRYVRLEVAQGYVECDDHVDAFGVDADAPRDAVAPQEGEGAVLAGGVGGARGLLRGGRAKVTGLADGAGG